jgi:hypothetical protein
LKTKVDVSGKLHKPPGHGEELFEAEPAVKGVWQFLCEENLLFYVE